MLGPSSSIPYNNYKSVNPLPHHHHPKEEEEEEEEVSWCQVLVHSHINAKQKLIVGRDGARLAII